MNFHSFSGVKDMQNKYFQCQLQATSDKRALTSRCKLFKCAVGRKFHKRQ